jgi:hypothetical protein
VFHQDDRDAEAVANSRDHGGGSAAFVGGHARDRLVQEQQARLHAEGAGEFGELLLPVREGARRAAEVGRDTDELGDLAYAFTVPALLAGRRGEAKSR